MSLKKVFFWFWSTLLIGGTISAIIGFSLEKILGINVFGSMIKQMLLAFTLTMMAELGFFSYLVFVWLMKGISKRKRYYHLILSIFFIIALGEYTYFTITQRGDFFIPMILIFTGIIVAILKVRLTERDAFIPTLFFMIVATALETIPSIHVKHGMVPTAIVLHSLIVLLMCNAWQILQLHRWVKIKNKS